MNASYTNISFLVLTHTQPITTTSKSTHNIAKQLSLAPDCIFRAETTTTQLPKTCNAQAMPSTTKTPHHPSPISTLPPELLLDIYDRLDGVSSLALRATNKDLHAILPAPRGGDTPLSKRLYVRLLAAASFRHALSLERAGQTHALRACAACTSAHPPEFFSAAQRARGPAERRCRGWERVFRLCEHTEVRFDDAPFGDPTADLERQASSSSARLECWADHGGEPRRPHLRFSVDAARAANVATAHRWVGLEGLPGAGEDGGVEVGEVLGALRGELGRRRLCPHRRVRDVPALLRLYVGEGEGEGEVVALGSEGEEGAASLQTRLDEKGFWSLYGVCEACRASFEVCRDVVGPGATGRVGIEVVRYWENMFEADDPMWLAQLEDPKEREEGWDENGWSKGWEKWA